MSSEGYFSHILATFQNGFCYEYIPGRPFVTKDSKELKIDDHHLRLIARQMANIHSTVVPEFDHTKTTYFDFYVNLLNTSKRWFDGLPAIEDLTKEVRIVEELVQTVQSPLVLCHGDPHPSNVVWNEQENKITFVDWEIAQIAPRGTDIAHFINSTKNVETFLQVPVTKPDDFERMFCEYYLQRCHELHGKPLPTNEEIEKLLLEVKYFSLVITLAWVVCFVKFDMIMASFGPPDVLWKTTLDLYMNEKEKLLGIRTLGLPTS